MGKTKNDLLNSGVFSTYRQRAAPPVANNRQQAGLSALVAELSSNPQIAITERGAEIWGRLLAERQGACWTQRLQFIFNTLHPTEPPAKLFAQLPAERLDYQRLNQALIIKRIDYFTELLSPPSPEISTLSMPRLIERFQETNSYLQAGGNNYQPIIEDLDLRISVTKERIKELLNDQKDEGARQQRSNLLKGLCFYDGLSNSVKQLADWHKQVYNPIGDLQALTSGLASIADDRHSQFRAWQQQEIDWISNAWPTALAAN